MGKVESQRLVFDILGSNPKTSKRKSIHDRLGIVQDVKNNASQHAEVESSKRLRSMIPSRMRRETDIRISCGEVLKVQPRTIVHTRVQKGENEESVGSSDDIVPPQGEEASSFHITLCDETPIEGEDAEEAPHELEEGVRAAIDELKEVDLGTPENPRPIFISTLLSNEDEEIYVTLLKEYIDVFAWTYKEMPGLDPKVAVHRLVVKKACRPVKQAQRRFRPELIPSIEGEVNKLIEVNKFIREVKYPTWICSIVPYGPIINLRPLTPELYPLVDMKRAILILLIANTTWSFTPIVKVTVRLEQILATLRDIGKPQSTWMSQSEIESSLAEVCVLTSTTVATEGVSHGEDRKQTGKLISRCVLTSTTVAVVVAVGETETTRRSVCPASIVRQRRVGTRKADAKSDKGLTPMSKKVNSQWLGQGFGEQDDAMPSQKLGCGDSRLTSVGATYGRLAAAEACRSRGRRCEVGTMVETF
nr:uncharacterized protein LOC109154689 [Ipomoea batatas]